MVRCKSVPVERKLLMISLSLLSRNMIVMRKSILKRVLRMMKIVWRKPG